MKNSGKAAFAAAMLIFGTIGVLRRYIDLPSGALAMLRGFIGAGFLAALMFVQGKRPDFKKMGKRLVWLIVSGAGIGLNWMLLFEAYNHTSVATATLCYYMAPVIVMLLSPVILKEKLTARRIVCIIAAVIGMIPVSGLMSQQGFDVSEMKGVLLGLAAAALYASVILMNKRITDVEPMDRTVVQLTAAAVVVMPYVFAAENFSPLDLSWLSILLVLIAGIVHTGIAYALYFGAIPKLKAQTVALASYIDPVFAVVLSAAVLGETMDLYGRLGAAVVIGAMMISELPEKNNEPRS